MLVVLVMGLFAARVVVVVVEDMVRLKSVLTRYEMQSSKKHT